MLTTERRRLAVSLAAVGAAAALAATNLRRRSRRRRSTLCLAARVVEEPPPRATVVDAVEEAFPVVPVARTAVRRAVRADAREEFERVLVESEGAIDLADALQRELPYFDSHSPGEAPSGVYLAYEDRVVVLDAVGWAESRR